MQLTDLKGIGKTRLEALQRASARCVIFYTPFPCVTGT